MGATPGAREAALSAWVEWRERCALSLCSRDAARMLSGFAGHRFNRFLGRLRGGGLCPSRGNMTPRHAWHLFETHLVFRNGRSGKEYKSWIFARVQRSHDDPLDVIQGGATLIVRDVVRDFIRREEPRRDAVSLSAPFLSDAGMLLTLDDLLAGESDPVDEVACREYDDLARRHAPGLFAGMSRRERILLLARELGLSLAHPAVEGAARCRKTVGCETLRQLLRRVFDGLKRAYRGEDRQAVARLTVVTLQHVSGMAREWGRAEGACAELFTACEKAEIPAP